MILIEVFLLLHYDKMALPSCVLVVLSPEFEPSVGGAVVGESFAVIACVKPVVGVVLESSGPCVGVVLGVDTAVVVVVVIGCSVDPICGSTSGGSIVIVTNTE